ncbi:hypothetical protein H4R34_005652 [Dimargaris verticillata]|uniref:Uncharacterized protein n=1 Tax=Dimargaris verticillata TaxID=2761393 RepID=A0A9W8B1U8_9FUNG|nr:hypothetical protein H4R34_005652 [Dimargaris verticillata]
MKVKVTATQLALVVCGSTQLAQCLARPFPVFGDLPKLNVGILGTLNPFQWGTQRAAKEDLEQGWGRDNISANSALVSDGTTTSSDSKQLHPVDSAYGGLLPTYYIPKATGPLPTDPAMVQLKLDDPELGYGTGNFPSTQNQLLKGSWSVL